MCFSTYGNILPWKMLVPWQSKQIFILLCFPSSFPLRKKDTMPVRTGQLWEMNPFLGPRCMGSRKAERSLALKAAGRKRPLVVSLKWYISFSTIIITWKDRDLVDFPTSICNQLRLLFVMDFILISWYEKLNYVIHLHNNNLLNFYYGFIKKNKNKNPQDIKS